MSLLRNVTPGKMSQFQESGSYCWWMFSFWWCYMVPTGNTSSTGVFTSFTQMLYYRCAHRCCIDVHMCFSHDWVWLGLIRLCDHDKDDVHPKSKMAAKWNISFVSFLLENMGFYHKLLEFYHKLLEYVKQNVFNWKLWIYTPNLELTRHHSEYKSRF